MRYLYLGLFAVLGACGSSGVVTGLQPGRPRLEISPGALIINLGAQGTLGVTAYDERGTAIESPVIQWRSTAPTIASVNPSGVVTGVASGTARIVATWNGVSDSAQVDVDGRQLILVTDPGSRTLVIGAILTVSATLNDSKGRPIPDPVTITWASSNPNVATIQDFQPGNGRVGMVTAVSPGTATISGTTGALVAAIQVSVLPPAQGSGSIQVLEARIVEYQYPGFPNWWFYAPLLRVEAREGAADVVGLQLEFPDRGWAPSFCGSIRILPFQPVDLNRELYGDYQISVDAGPGYRAPAGVPFRGRLSYRRGDGEVTSVQLELPVASGGLPTTYTGGVGLWRSCVP